jgi:2-amino-4-hydroxy-6-hydroxymethyldihydropteridine diphosphokinase
MSSAIGASREPVAVALGSNLGDRAAFMAMARVYLGAGRLVHILKASSLYETEPVESGPQRWFLNQALWVETDLPPALLLSHCKRVENLLGRKRSEPHGPRNMDIDILFSGSLVISTPLLTLPHPALPRRRSILQPLAELGIPWRHPSLGADVPSLLNSCKDRSRVSLFLPELAGD